MAKVLVTRRVPAEAIQLLKDANCELDYWEKDEPIPRDELLNKVKGKDAIFCLLTEKIDGELLDAAGPQLKVVATMSVGYDHVDTKEIAKRNLCLGFTPGVLTDATATLNVALLLAVSRRIVEAAAEAKNGGWGTWKPMWMTGPTLKGSTVGVVGLGRIGVAVCQRLAPFGVAKFLYNDIAPRDDIAKMVDAVFADKDTLFRESDFVVSCTLLTDETRGMFNKDAFSKMKKNAVFVNASRGGVVNQDDLYQALKNGEIRGAGLDVTVPEPIPLDHPLLTLKNCVVLPHIGSAEEQTRTDMATLTSRNILAGLKGDKLPAAAQL
ncbi:glyoxylate reductase/hydroxypyruvate reductase [Exaiptasia diaphana]|uniref:Glyoxylate reductase/hydroxypyruvate reductase n=1 Tax=Exaiptasia diaphana TaxID=2652724 RepID=A0A913XUT6_EXADI|nr:glyoxylate reductase/hydroxypyruvate reductase [Exaiptasia diaphana]KXJ08689.1 Glyoxylate reductase/hydroxypyruvate reductase [Exaiptasia diaphana]